MAMDSLLPGAAGPPAPDPDATFQAIWEIRDAIVRQVWGEFDAVFVHRDAAQATTGYVYVSEIPPAAQAQAAAHWTYVTGGLALPWTDDLAEVNAADYSATLAQVTAEQLAAAAVFGIELSGYGFELVLHTPAQAPWAVSLLHNLGAYVFRTGDTFAGGQRVPLEGEIALAGESALHVLIFAPPADRSPLFKLPSGFAQWLVVVGITTDEWEYAQREGSTALIAALRAAGVADLTDPARSSIFLPPAD
jgi:hypothetical protein